MNLEAQAFWRDWIDGDHDVPGLRLHTIPLLEHMRTASQDEDWEQLERLLQTYSYVADLCQDEPLLTTYEGGLMYLNVYLADLMWVQGDLERALEHLEWVKHTLQEGDQRRQEMGMAERPNSELRYKSIGIRSACFSEDTDLFEAGSPELETTMLAAEFWRLADTTVAHLRDHRSEDEDYISVIMHDLARWELEVCKLCQYFSPAFADVAVDFFNSRIGNHLEKPLRHFETLDPLDNRTSWYWDFELCKLDAAGDFSRTEVLHCADNRNTSARLSFGKGPAKSLFQPWERQVKRMLSHAGS